MDELITEERFKEIIDLVDPRDKAAFTLLYLLGLRPNELRSLTRTDFSTHDNKLWINVQTFRPRPRNEHPPSNFKRLLYIDFNNSFLNNILNYVKDFPPGQPLFPYGNSNNSCHRILNKKLEIFKVSVKDFKENRNLALRKTQDMKKEALCYWGGYADARSVEKYYPAKPTTVQNSSSVPNNQSSETSQPNSISN